MVHGTGLVVELSQGIPNTHGLRRLLHRTQISKKNNESQLPYKEASFLIRKLAAYLHKQARNR